MGLQSWKACYMQCSNIYTPARIIKYNTFFLAVGIVESSKDHNFSFCSSLPNPLSNIYFSQSGEPPYCYDYLIHISLLHASSSYRGTPQEWGLRYPLSPSTWFTVLSTVILSNSLWSPIRVIHNDKRTTQQLCEVGQ